MIAKKNRGQEKLNQEQKAFSKAISRMTHPIEALFSWVNRLTSIQNADLFDHLQDYFHLSLGGFFYVIKKLS